MRRTRQTPAKNNFISFVLAAVLLLGAGCGPVFADAEMRRVVIGADLTDDQVNAVYSVFGLVRGEIPELRLTNAEEHAALDGYVEEAVIGTRSMSCVYLELLPLNSGMNVITQNISWCTPDMYRNALLTAGIQDARIAVAAPFSVSGTAGLAGIYKAYEDMTGQKLSAMAKDAGTQELTITGELANEIGSADSTSIVNDLKAILNETVSMSDEEVKQTIRRIAGNYHVNLTDSQVQQLLSLCRSLEKLDTEGLTEKVGSLQETIEKVSDAKDNVVGFMQTLHRAFGAVKSFFDRINEIFSRR